MPNSLMQNWEIAKNLWNTFGNNPDNQKTVDSMKGMLGLLPAGAGDVASGLLAADDVRRGDYGSAALNGVGVLPLIPALAGTVTKDGLESVLQAIRSSGVEASAQVYPMTENAKDIYLASIKVPKEKRNAGLGTEAMNKLLSYADAENARVYLYPSTDLAPGQTNLNRLKQFYKRQGFVENKGKNKDYELPLSAAMYRNPNLK